MTKTIRGQIKLEDLKTLLTQHARTLPSYQRVVSDTLRLDFIYSHGIRLELREPYGAKCWHCEGSGKSEYYADKEGNCKGCGGSGKRTDYHYTTARIQEYEDGKHVGQLKIMIDTASGNDYEDWKPQADKVKSFIEGLVKEPCITVPMSKRQQVEAEMKKLDELLEASVEKIRGKVGENDGNEVSELRE